MQRTVKKKKRLVGKAVRFRLYKRARRIARKRLKANRR